MNLSNSRTSKRPVPAGGRSGTPQAAHAPLHIGAIAARTGRSIYTIRWYESLGLMPGVTRDAGGRRVYNERHVDWLVLMDRLRRTGMSITQIREYTALVRQGRSTLRQRQALLAAHRARVEQTIAEWTDALGLLDTKIDFYGEWLATGQRPPSLFGGGSPPSSAGGPAFSSGSGQAPPRPEPPAGRAGGASGASGADDWPPQPRGRSAGPPRARNRGAA